MHLFSLQAHAVYKEATVYSRSQLTQLAAVCAVEGCNCGYMLSSMTLESAPAN